MMRRRIAIHEEHGGSQYMRQFQEEMMQRGVHCLGLAVPETVDGKLCWWTRQRPRRTVVQVSSWS